MKSRRPNSTRIVLCTALALAAAGVSTAQEAPSEELEMIDLDAERDEAREARAADDGQDIEGLEYDQQSQSYRLIEEPDEDRVEPPSQRELDRQEIIRLFALYRDAVGSKNYVEADTLAKQIIELSIRVFGLESDESAKALTNLAIAQHGNREYEAAEQNYRAAIDIIERISDRLNESLINPLKGLGATQLATGRPDMARQTLQRAVHVSHVNMGPHNKDQIDVLESMAEIYLSVGEHSLALDVQEQMFAIQARNIEEYSLDILPALKKQAQWQHRLQMYDRERITWRHVVSVLEHHYGKDDLRLIPPLTSLGKSYLFITPAEYDLQPEISVSSGESYLRRANRIADNHPQSTWQIVDRTLLSLGDYYVLSGRPNRAARVYAELWLLLSEDDERLDIRADRLERLNVLQNVFPPKYYNTEPLEARASDPSEFLTGTVTYGFTVNASGRPANIMHIETQPPEFEDMSERVRRNLRHLVYRPRLEDGKLVTTPEIIYTHEFFYRPEDIPLPPAEDDVTESR